MTDISSIINIQISRETTAVARASFSIPCFIASHTAFSERAREYTNLKAVAGDFDTASNVYQAATEFFSQQLVPATVVIGRRQVDSVTGSVGTVSNVTLYTLTVDGHVLSYTSDSSATAIEIVAGLKAALTGAPITGITMTDNLDGTFTIGVSAPGTAWSIVPSSNMVLANVAPTETWPATIAAVQAVDNTWYGLTAESHVDADILAIAGYIETQKKIYAYSTSEAAVGTSATNDIASQLKALGYQRTFGLWNADDDAYPECGWMGGQLPYTPGENAWDYKQIVGAIPDNLTATQTTYMHTKNISTYETIAGVNATVGGHMAGGEFIDIIIGVDWTEARLTENIWFRMTNSKKIPFTDAGITIIETEIRKVLAEGIANGLFADSPAPVVTVPKALSVSQNLRALRTLNGVTFEARLAGAISFIGISGVVFV